MAPGEVGYRSAQVDVIKRIFTLTQEELWEAAEIVENFKKRCEEALALRGRMIEGPVYLRAKKIAQNFGAV